MFLKSNVKGFQGKCQEQEQDQCQEQRQCQYSSQSLQFREGSNFLVRSRANEMATEIKLLILTKLGQKISIQTT